MVGVPRIELGMHIGAGFTGPLSHQTWRHPIGCSGPNRTAYLVVMSTRAANAPRCVKGCEA